MPDPAGTYQDGGVIHGSQRVTMKNVDGVNEEYVLRNLTTNFPMNKIVRKNEYGVPDGQVFISDIITGSATGQFSTSTSKLPKQLEPVTFAKRGGGTVEFIVETVSDSWVADGESTFNITFSKKFAT